MHSKRNALFGESIPAPNTTPFDPADYAAFECLSGHEWAGKLPSLLSADWPTCPTCGGVAYVREPL